jgi:hypothetical protein
LICVVHATGLPRNPARVKPNHPVSRGSDASHFIAIPRPGRREHQRSVAAGVRPAVEPGRPARRHRAPAVDRAMECSGAGPGPRDASPPRQAGRLPPQVCAPHVSAM